MSKITSRRSFMKNAGYAGGGALLGVAALNQLSPHVWSAPLQLEPNFSYWARSQPPLNPRLMSNLSVDVAVIGGGFTGLSSAYYIRKASPQKTVAVFEARGCGNGASGRNGAMLLNMTEDTFMNFSSDPSLDKRIYDLTAANIRSLSKLAAAMGADCELSLNGALQVFEHADDMRATKAYVERARKLGMPVELWNASQIAETIGSPIYAGAYFDPNAGQVHPMKLVRLCRISSDWTHLISFEWDHPISG